MGDVIVLSVLAAIIYLVVRSIVKNHKKGGCCSGNCAGCSAGCNHTKTQSKFIHEIKKFAGEILLRTFKIRKILFICVFLNCFKAFFTEYML